MIAAPSWGSQLSYISISDDIFFVYFIDSQILKHIEVDEVRPLEEKTRFAI